MTLTFEEIQASLKHGDMFVAYLPTVMLVDGRCIGAEALLRWKRGQDVLLAGDFIPFIENTPMSGMITYWVIETIGAELGEWLSMHPLAHVSFNVPPEILGRGGVVYAAARAGLRDRVGQLVMEITERGVPDRLGLDALNTMAARGLRIALDDVTLSGTNLALLTRCNVDMIKIDCATIAQLRHGKPAPEWLGGLEALLKSNRSLQVVAEGVESDYQANTLRAVGVQMAQGHFFSAPLSASRFMSFCAANCKSGVASTVPAPVSAP